jgi:putative membrane protein
MFVEFHGSLIGIITWQSRNLLVFGAAATSMTATQMMLELETLQLPSLPLAVVGGAVGIFASFRTNSAYDRWWEGRRLWGQLVNVSRLFATQVLLYLRSAESQELAPVLVRRHIAYVHLLRCLLRRQDPDGDEDFARFLTESDRHAVRGQRNMTYALLHLQADSLVAEAAAGRLDPFRLQSLDETIGKLLDIQGACERIKNTPMPRGYSFILERLIYAYSFLLPLTLTEALEWMAIPLTVVVCFAFALISEAGRVLEDPFTMNWPAVPLSALSKTIEIDLRQRLGETDLPPPPASVPPGVLM